MEESIFSIKSEPGDADKIANNEKLAVNSTKPDIAQSDNIVSEVLPEQKATINLNLWIENEDLSVFDKKPEQISEVQTPVELLQTESSIISEPVLSFGSDVNLDSVNNENITSDNTSIDLDIDLSASEQVIDNTEEPKEKKSMFWMFSLWKKKERYEDWQANEVDLGSLQTNEVDLWSVDVFWNKIDSSPNSSWLIIEDTNKWWDIFQDLELWELNFWNLQEEEIKQKEPIDPLKLATSISNYLFWGLFVFAILGFCVVYVRILNYDFITSIPGACDFIWYSLNYDNSECKTVPQIVEKLDKQKKDIEFKLSKDLAILIPKKLRSNYILSSDEVKFIQEKTSDSRIMITKVLEDFESIRKDTWIYKWDNIECSNIKANELWEIELNCTFYWSAISESTPDGKSATSRWVALEFLSKLQWKNSNFQLLSYPKSLDIQRYNWTEWIKMIFATSTQLQLKLKYTLSSKL